MNWQTNSDILLAHTGHPHRNSNQVSQPSQTGSDAATTNKPAPEVMPEMTPLEAEVNSATEEVPATEPVTNSASSTVSSFPGLGESILALLLAGPFVLRAIKRWLHQ